MTDTNYNKFKESLHRLKERYDYYLMNTKTHSFVVELPDEVADTLEEIIKYIKQKRKIKHCSPSQAITVAIDYYAKTNKIENKDNESSDTAMLESIESCFQRSEILESIKESCIQRFEICFDTSWKHLRKYLIEEMGLVDIQNSPNPIFRKAAANNLISDAELWIEFNKKRGDTVHDYCGDKADETFAIIPDFIKHAIDLYEIISGDKWRSN